MIKRHRWRRTLFGAYDERAALEIPHTDPQPDVQMDIVILREALQLLPEKQREAVVLFDILGLSLEEIKAIQGGTLSGVKSRLKRGRAELQRKLGVSDDVSEPARTIIPRVHNQPISVSTMDRQRR
ncbi:MAG: RNA polymerase sigma factor [Candidatus Kapabacteria bacterium]|nr:RNA polymerase sigma factor [Candidatus Kapabacteria bacterium]